MAGQLAEIARERSAAILLSGHDTALVHSIADDVVELGALRPSVFSAAIRRKASGPTPRFDIAAESAKHPHVSSADPADGPALGGRAEPEPVPVPIGGESIGGRESKPAVPEACNDRDRDRDGDGDGDLASARAWDVAVSRNGHSSPAVVATDNRSPDVVLRARDISASISGHQVLADIDLALEAGSALAVVGASGAGKTTLARVIAGLHRSANGSLELRGHRIAVGAKRRIRYGAGGIQLVTQNPRSALNPRRTVAQTLGRPLRRIGGVARRDLAGRITELLAAVELSADLAARYPHELSGGQRQRVALARALAAEPAVLLCDEITSALDHTTAVAIMGLLDRIRAERGTALLIITHDMALVAEYCPALLVLDHGRIVESGHTATVLAAPTHNATGELLV
ncbi:ABC transporter ATP-binding protein [Nocardia abscessus]|nr:ABC transporter ATP-binding protein [Nocardia abscessus]